VSLGSSLCLELYRTKEDGALDRDPVHRILQEPRSLLITTDDLYTEYLHGIADAEEDADLSAETVANWELLGSGNGFGEGKNVRQMRVSLTYRDVLKVVKLGNRFNNILGRR
jgi:alkylated DNA repair protein alkB family protein 6